MSLLIRKINRAKWPENDNQNVEDISADAITNCLRTQLNGLSVWEIPSKNELQDAVLAIASSQHHLEAFDVIPLRTEYLTEQGIDIDNEAGGTPIKDLIKMHRNLAHLSYSKIGIIAHHAATNIEQARRFTKVQLKEILQKAISEGRLEVDKLCESVRNKI